MNETGLIARAANLARLRAAASFSSKVKADTPPPALTCPKDRYASLRTDAEYPCGKTCKFWQFFQMQTDVYWAGSVWSPVIETSCYHICYLFLLLYSTLSANVMSHMQLHLLNTVKRCPPPPLVGPPEKNHTKRMPPTAWASIVKLSNRLTKRWPAPSVAVPDHILQPHHSNIDTEQKKPQASNITGVICKN